MTTATPIRQPYAADDEEGDQHDQRDADARKDRRIDVDDMGLFAGLEDVAEQADDVVADRSDLQALNRLLHGELCSGVAVHGVEQLLALLLELDIDAGAQQLSSTSKLA